ncbi:porin family protein [Hymenobacter sediminicola]|uniref:PorT family protein n=1 Tax=Hymenobacter sediminicola TaxID=2761579 RepID=A0A7G7W7H9_9BACT|nr:porin family protein [Hymenobacter sediminicola]QNH62322.1 PorT family protein [Hymenobacter sediminicola]
MNTKRIFGRLAAATLLLSVFGTAAQAQVQTHRVPAYTGKAQARPVTSYKSAARSTGGPQLGIRAGVNVSDWSGDAVQSVMDLAGYTNGAVTKSMKTGFHAGLYATLPLAPGFSIEPGVLYSEKGTKLTGSLPFEQFDFLNARVTATSRMSYVDVPVLAKVDIVPGFYLFAGPQASFLVSGKARVEAGLLGFDAYQQDFDIKDQFRPVDFSVTGGLGYQSTSGFGLSAGYDYGLSSLDKNNRFDAYNRVIKASVNYSF